MLVVATVPNVIVILAGVAGLVPESIRWLLCKRNVEGAMTMVKRIAKINRITINEPKVMKDLDSNLPRELPLMTNTEENLLKRLKSNGKFSLRAILTLMLCFIAYTCYYGHVGNTANLGNDNKFLPYVFGAIPEMAVVFSIPPMLNRCGRRWTLIAMLLIATVSSFFYAFPPGQLSQWSTNFAIISRVCAAGSYYACLQFASEIFLPKFVAKALQPLKYQADLGFSSNLKSITWPRAFIVPCQS